MSLILALAATIALATSGAPQTPPCPDGTTQDLNKCFAERLARADAERLRYGAAVRVRLTGEAAQATADDKSATKALAGFDRAEEAWSKYRDAECRAVYDYWSEGTIRDVEDLSCQIKLTQLHTHTIWLEWLTYMDSTPPILPEPPVPPDD